MLGQYHMKKIPRLLAIDIPELHNHVKRHNTTVYKENFAPVLFSPFSPSGLRANSKLGELNYTEKKGRDLTQSYDKSPYTNRNVKRAK